MHKTNYDAEPLPMETVITQIISIVTKDKNALPLASKAFLQCLLANQHNMYGHIWIAYLTAHEKCLKEIEIPSPKKSRSPFVFYLVRRGCNFCG